LTYADSDDEGEDKDENVNNEHEENEDGSSDGAEGRKKKGAGTTMTAELINAMQSPNSIKTYVALVRGEGILCGEDLTKKGWFEVNRPIKDPSGELKEASTYFRFVAGQAESGIDRPRICLVLARPKQGRWHQIRRHLNGLSHPIIGDSTHGVSTVNREWRVERNMPGERIALHLGRIQLVPTVTFPEGIDVSAPMLEDMLDMLKVYAPEVLERSLPILEKEGILVDVTSENQYEVGSWTIPDVLLQPKPVLDDGDVDILEEGKHFVVVCKPPVVVVHHSSWTSSTRADPNLRWREKIPMLQRVRSKTSRRVNLVHRLDRGASGCLLLTFAESQDTPEDGEAGSSCRVTKTLIESMQHPNATKTYFALCDGSGIWNGVNYLEKGWFTFCNPVKDDQGNLIEDAETELRFIASAILPPVDNVSGDPSTGDDDMEGRRVSLVLARPKSGRWHQIRQHLASGTIGHAIIGDSSHGRSRTNRIWKKTRHLVKERVCLHLCRLQLPPADYTPDGIDVTCSLATMN
jgi:23S rRNA-/tRNA-specific pseudouridylate synthase